MRITRKARFRNWHLHHWPLCECSRRPSHASDLISSLLPVPWVTVELQIGLRLHPCKSWGCSRLSSALRSRSTQTNHCGTGFLPIWWLVLPELVSGPHQVLGCFRSPCSGNLSPWQQGTQPPSPYLFTGSPRNAVGFWSQRWDTIMSWWNLFQSPGHQDSKEYICITQNK